MKKTMIIWIVCISFGCFAQTTEFYGRYFRIGWNVCGMTLSGLNSSIDIYNQNRLWLSDELEHFGFMHGPAFGFGYEWKILRMELLWTNQHDIIHAAGTEPGSGNFAERKIKIRFNLLTK